jgi:hypothetical protein
MRGADEQTLPGFSREGITIVTAAGWSFADLDGAILFIQAIDKWLGEIVTCNQHVEPLALWWTRLSD